MAKPRKRANIVQQATAVSEGVSRQDEQSSLKADERRGQRSQLRLDRIKPRTQDTRELRKEHVEALKDSIAALGLIEPLVVDADRVLLAGGHRLEAIALLKDEDPDKFQKHFSQELIPVRIMPFKASENQDLALKIEIAENEQRYDYTPKEVRELFNRLMEGDEYKYLRGRPNKGEKPIMPAIATVIGKSIRTVERYLSEENPPKAKRKSTTSVVLLEKANKSLKAWHQQAIKNKSTVSAELLERVSDLLPLLKDAIDQSK